MRIRGDREAFGAPGIAPRWSHANKDGIGTAYSGDSRVWFTLFRGSLTEVYYPLVDRPQTRDLQFMITDGRTFFHEDRRHLPARVERLNDLALGYRVEQRDPEGRYVLHKEIIAAPHLPVVLQRTRFERTDPAGARLRLFALCAPHVDGAGWGNTGYVVEHDDGLLVAAERNGRWLAVGASTGFAKASVGFVGASDGWTDLHLDRSLDWEFDRATNGNVALVGEIEPPADGTFTLGLAFGEGLPHAVSALTQALGTPYDEHRRRFLLQWERAHERIPDRRALTGDGGHLYRSSVSVVLAHEDKSFPGALIAALSIPWGNTRTSDDLGGYHLVWTRDLVRSAMGLLAAGDTTTAMRSMIYLATIQRPDGGFPQNSWLDGTPFWTGVQLDEVAYPVLLAVHLARAGALGAFDPYPMVRGAIRYLLLEGPATGQERWEEAAGISPSTLAVHIAALVAGAGLLRDRGDVGSAALAEWYADFLEGHLEPWTVTGRGDLVPDHPRHYIRLLPMDLADPSAPEDPDTAELVLANQPPDAPTRFPARQIVDGGFLELVRHGVRRATDPTIVASVEVIDAVLRTESPAGPLFHRYNHDGYGQRDDGGPYDGWGVGRAWPLLTGERGHYELARGGDARPYARTLERLATATGLLAEQVWDGDDHPALHLWRGRPTGAAMPLAWAHAEYLLLLRSIEDGAVFDRLPEVARRYAEEHRGARPREVWKFNRQLRTVPPSTPVRILAGASFRLRAALNGAEPIELPSSPTILDVDYADLPILDAAGDVVEFTFYWTASDRWEGRSFRLKAVDPFRGPPAAAPRPPT